VPQRIPCSSCGELKSVTPKSHPEGAIVCQPCRAKRRLDAEAGRVAYLTAQRERPCAECGERTDRPRSEFCSRACQLAHSLPVRSVPGRMVNSSTSSSRSNTRPGVPSANSTVICSRPSDEPK
jgi:hypothetical protein